MEQQLVFVGQGDVMLSAVERADVEVRQAACEPLQEFGRDGERRVNVLSCTRSTRCGRSALEYASANPRSARDERRSRDASTDPEKPQPTHSIEATGASILAGPALPRRRRARRLKCLAARTCVVMLVPELRRSGAARNY
jgi:hypothetical protein